VKVSDIAKNLGLNKAQINNIFDRLNIRGKHFNSKIDKGLEKKIRDFHSKETRKAAVPEEEKEPLKVSLKEKTIKIENLITLFEVSVQDMMRVFLKEGFSLNINSEVDQETAKEIGLHLNIDLSLEDTTVEEEIGLKTTVMELEEDALAKGGKVIERPPVIAIMGHVDHGKTKLLDSIRKARVADTEAGGITQHIGAYQVTFSGKKITFLDTPGHEAFTSLRARGAQITDIVILVVAADEGIKPQTREAINHAKAADVPIIVAINKIDKPGADIEKVKTALSGENLVPEEWGGSTVTVPLSAITGEGIDTLLEMITLVAEMQELKAAETGLAKGVVIEANLSKQRGPIATILIRTGKLSIGDHFVVGPIYGKVRAMFNDSGKPVKSADPGMPIELLGLSDVPLPGVILEAKKTEKEAKLIAQERTIQDTSLRQASQQRAVSLESLSSQAEEGGLRQLNLVIKSDVVGSLEAIRASIEKIDSKDIPIRILHAATGTITENDIMLAQASSAIVFGFGVDTKNTAEELAKKEGIILKTYSIIYDIIDDIERVIKGMYKPVFEEVELGKAEVRQLFKFSKIGVICGCFVTSGKITRNADLRVLRDGKDIYSGKVESLKRFKDDVKSVSEGYECGIVMGSFNDIKENDILYVFETRELKPI
jgi:translation initiation factor IF-2